MRITTTDLVVFALSLDDPAMQHERGLTVSTVSKTRSAIEGSPEEIAMVLDDVLSRSEPDSWDQPENWRKACARAFPRIKAEIETQGYDVRVVGSTVNLIKRS